MDFRFGVDPRERNMRQFSIKFLVAFILVGILLSILTVTLVIVRPDPIKWAKTKFASDPKSYLILEEDKSTGFFRDKEVQPLPSLPFVDWRILSLGAINLAPSIGVGRRASYLADVHWSLKITVLMPAGSMAGLSMSQRLSKAAAFGKARWQEPGPWCTTQPMPGSLYARYDCIDCHQKNKLNRHVIRGKKTCRQCHGPEPIAGIKHYYSSMNTNRRHAYVCAKCHEGASASYSSYVVHAPNPSSIDTQKIFPVLFYVFWSMVAIAVGTFAVFLPHTALWGIRELFVRNNGEHDESEQ